MFSSNAGPVTADRSHATDDNKAMIPQIGGADNSVEILRQKYGVALSPRSLGRFLVMDDDGVHG